MLKDALQGWTSQNEPFKVEKPFESASRSVRIDFQSLLPTCRSKASGLNRVFHMFISTCVWGTEFWVCFRMFLEFSSARALCIVSKAGMKHFASILAIAGVGQQLELHSFLSINRFSWKAAKVQYQCSTRVCSKRIGSSGSRVEE